MKKFLDKIPVVLASNLSVFIFLFLFVYLFIFGVLGLLMPKLAPSQTMQMVLGNYTNVTSALGAAISAGAATAAHASVKKLHEKNENLTKSIKDLHEKHDATAQSLSKLHEKIDKMNQ